MALSEDMKTVLQDWNDNHQLKTLIDEEASSIEFVYSDGSTSAPLYSQSLAKVNDACVMLAAMAAHDVIENMRASSSAFLASLHTCRL